MAACEESERISCLDTGEVFSDVESAARFANCRPEHMLNAIRNRSLVRGMRFCPERMAGELSKADFAQGQAREVVCVETGEVFVSLAEAAHAFGARDSKISLAATTLGTCSGVHWRYRDESRSHPLAKPVRVVEQVGTGRAWVSVDEAARFAGCSGYALRGRLDSGAEWRWRVLPEADGLRDGVVRPVRVRETGAVYDSVFEASIAEAVKPSRLVRALITGAVADGRHFDYAGGCRG